MKGYKETEDYWAFQLKDHHEDSFKKLEIICKKLQDLDLGKIEEEMKMKDKKNFVIVL